MIGWLIFAAYVLVGVMRMRTYFERVHVYEAENAYGTYHREEGNTLAFWCAIGIMTIWPLWEIQYYLRHFVVQRFSTDEYRLRQEDIILEQAKQILKERNGKVNR